MMKFFVATHNDHKIIEFKRILNPLGFDVLSLSDFDAPFCEVDETGTTFEENAFIKAKSGCEFSNMPTIADDSGLCVDALNGEPGVFSARYAGTGNDKDNNKKLLEKLKEVEEKDRTARFVSAVCCVFPDGRSFTVKGICEGKIAFEESGNNGFGYDPLFVSEVGNFAEVSGDTKDLVSHRSKALKEFKETINKYV